MNDGAWTAWPAPAKLNLFLHIVGRRADGYHLLQTVFQLLDWGDTVHMRMRDDGVVRCAHTLPGIDPEQDLCARAARVLQTTSTCGRGVEIRVDKRIPIGGGLGGGSSDAASVLVGLNEMWGTGLGVDALADLGLQLGADVPVFVRGHSAWAEGVGEMLTPISLPERYYVIVDPKVRVPTASLFQVPELTRNSPPATISGYLSGSETGNFEAGNVFAQVVRARYPDVAAALDWLGRFGAARLSGSGGCAFVEMESGEAAAAIVRACPATFAAFAARGVAGSPLLVAVAAYRRGRAAV